MTDSEKLAKALAYNDRAGKSSKKMLDFLVRTGRVPYGVTIELPKGGRYIVTFRH